MTGLESIILQIKADADVKALEIKEQTEKAVKEIIKTAEEQKAVILEEYLKIAEQKRTDIEKRTESLKKTERSNSILGKKQAIIKAAAERAKSEIKSFEDGTYFAFLSKLLQKSCLDEKGSILLSVDDVKRMPESFRAELRKNNLKIEETLQKGGNGFVLVYGNIEVNCSIDELFRSKKSEISDFLNRLLFH